jgi:anthranilate synthase component 1
LRAALARAPRPRPEVPGLPFAGGLVGVSGYDVVRLFEKLPHAAKAQAGVPLAAFTATSSTLVFDHLTRRVALLHDGSESERQSLRREVMALLRGAVPPNRNAVSISVPEPGMSERNFGERVAVCKEHIAAGDIYQIVLSVLFRGRANVEPFEVYRALRLLNPSPYMFFFEFGDLKVVGSSPEALVKLHGRSASLRPIAGTLPRGKTPQEDAQNEQALLADPKESAEHVMLVDLARNDLGRVASPGTVRVDPYRAIERYSHVMHIVSGVQGELAPQYDAFDLFAASFPAGTLVGAPKVRAMQIIDELEETGRGLYAGTAGYYGIGGDMDQAITIRTLVFNGDGYTFQAGAGIVADSVPRKEYQEVLAKGAILKSALEMAGEGL